MLALLGAPLTDAGAADPRERVARNAAQRDMERQDSKLAAIIGAYARDALARQERRKGPECLKQQPHAEHAARAIVDAMPADLARPRVKQTSPHLLELPKRRQQALELINEKRASKEQADLTMKQRNDRNEHVRLERLNAAPPKHIAKPDPPRAAKQRELRRARLLIPARSDRQGPASRARPQFLDGSAAVQKHEHDLRRTNAAGDFAARVGEPLHPRLHLVELFRQLCEGHHPLSEDARRMLRQETSALPIYAAIKMHLTVPLHFLDVSEEEGWQSNLRHFVTWLDSMDGARKLDLVASFTTPVHLPAEEMPRDMTAAIIQIETGPGKTRIDNYRLLRLITDAHTQKADWYMVDPASNPRYHGVYDEPDLVMTKVDAANLPLFRCQAMLFKAPDARAL
jgi:hypothetical protein